jgi:hypothetical protein
MGGNAAFNSHKLNSKVSFDTFKLAASNFLNSSEMALTAGAFLLQEVTTGCPAAHQLTSFGEPDAFLGSTMSL